MNIGKSLLEHLIKLLKQSGVNSKKQAIEELQKELEEEKQNQMYIKALPAREKNIYYIGQTILLYAYDIKDAARARQLDSKGGKEDIENAINGIKREIKEIKKELDKC